MGLMYHTLGQRQGLGIGGVRGANEEPWYVAVKDLERYVLVAVQGTDHPLLFTNSLSASDIHWINGAPQQSAYSCTAKTRYRQADQDCVVSKTVNGWQVDFSEPQRAVTPGQSVVFYQGNVCLGGGVIEQTANTTTANPSIPARVSG